MRQAIGDSEQLSVAEDVAQRAERVADWSVKEPTSPRWLRRPGYGSNGVKHEEKDET